MFNLPIQPRFVFAPGLLILLSGCFAGLNLNDNLEFNRTLVAQGEFWRIFTSQFVHANWPHFVLNTAGIVLIWLLHGEYTSARRYAINSCFLALWCGIFIWFFAPDIHIYTGLSAVLHGVIIWGAVKDISLGLKSGYLLFLGTWIKLIAEQVNGPSKEIGELINSSVAIDAHLFGALGGLVLALPLVLRFITQKKTQAKN